MYKIKEVNNLIVNKNGTIGDILSTYIDDYISDIEVNKINKKIEKLNKKLKNLDIFNYKLSNRIKIRNLIVKLYQKIQIFL